MKKDHWGGEKPKKEIVRVCPSSSLHIPKSRGGWSRGFLYPRDRVNLAEDAAIAGLIERAQSPLAMKW
ncbi:hypothetical protein BFU36_06530 [Sulfolobus sp. A20]|uniref:hypothetical protein n=1 Tax=Saccharolobus sp. A20 TaxID=1891280 RepID=UPI000845DB32|nr:hypothetical protein [Sulfolobus sp. A20]TRM75151.1 hypothetical protein DJ523_03395 [Sulfolobus sp. E5]TRM76791.1 hypothetical protein DJ532_06645 [Sulfolobus sp. A20-N-F8]TRM77825.1 hypothetical protein DJ528_05980 [Sulfolobus sp. B5]TRM81379.1 hypothetical protein DJ524_04300 [Sulfolobus sp. D5]TRM83683.1 hypothetical protein DJ531_04330 [Sulfolobus sp. A20-N-F6]TRM88278.1 hypothetical protein DJ529_05795 [Sulfolobus sp. C3]TRM95240.1 hypothetical protein DJ526_00880 [Sulfolobus sp. A2